MASCRLSAPSWVAWPAAGPQSSSPWTWIPAPSGFNPFVSPALASDIAGAVLDERFDVVVTNPPFHVGKATDLDVPIQFINDAHNVLASGGRMFLVANRTLPYEQAIKRRFGNVSNVHDGPRFKVLSAVRANG